MGDLVYSGYGIEIWNRSGKFFIRYDAGSHLVAMREDEISEKWAKLASYSFEEATDILFSVQRKLIDQGVDPHKGNI